MVMLVLSVKHIACSELTSTLDCSAAQGFRVFHDPDVQDIGSRLPPDSLQRLSFAAKTGESHIVRMTRSSQLGIAQEGASINLDCQPWLSPFPDGSSVRWRFIQLDQLGNPLGIFPRIVCTCTFITKINLLCGHCNCHNLKTVTWHTAVYLDCSLHLNLATAITTSWHNP